MTVENHIWPLLDRSDFFRNKILLIHIGNRTERGQQEKRADEQNGKTT